MKYCPYCKQKVSLNDLKTEIKGKGFLKQEIMHVCHTVKTFLELVEANMGRTFYCNWELEKWELV